MRSCFCTLGVHTVVAHCLKVQALEIRQEKGVALRVPGAISNVHRVRGVDAGPRLREPLARHSDDERLSVRRGCRRRCEFGSVATW